MLYRTLKTLIAKGKTNGLSEKIDVFYAIGKLSDGETQDLNSSVKGV